jgi:hypothetical protein
MPVSAQPPPCRYTIVILPAAMAAVDVTSWTPLLRAAGWDRSMAPPQRGDRSVSRPRPMSWIPLLSPRKSIRPTATPVPGRAGTAGRGCDVGRAGRGVVNRGVQRRPRHCPIRALDAADRSRHAGRPGQRWLPAPSTGRGQQKSAGDRAQFNTRPKMVLGTPARGRPRMLTQHRESYRSTTPVVSVPVRAARSGARLEPPVARRRHLDHATSPRVRCRVQVAGDEGCWSRLRRRCPATVKTR